MTASGVARTPSHGRDNMVKRSERKSISVRDTEWPRLAASAKRRGVSIAQLITEAVDKAVDE